MKETVKVVKDQDLKLKAPIVDDNHRRIIGKVLGKYLLML